MINQLLIIERLIVKQILNC